MADATQPNQTSYFDAIGPGDFELAVGNYTFGSTNESRVQVIMGDGIPRGDDVYDIWQIWVPSPRVSGPEIDAEVSAFLALADPTATALSSGILIALPDLVRFESARVGVSRESNLFIAGKVLRLEALDHVGQTAGEPNR
ncbi:MAG TPA: hypothetical protein VL049_24025 [Candidatus Dormibacteraeota bacterium]|nr:hypothetical protein [Candidatus Dormibacteraeota bacterium]